MLQPLLHTGFTAEKKITKKEVRIFFLSRTSAKLDNNSNFKVRFAIFHGHAHTHANVHTLR
jgi:hypothetical protein